MIALPPDPGEQRAGLVAADGSPGVERCDWVGESVLAVSDGDLLAVAFSVALGLPDVQQEPGGLVLDVGQVECHEFGTAHGGCVAKQDEGGVADAVRGAAVDAAHDVADLFDGQRPGEAAP